MFRTRNPPTVLVPDMVPPVLLIVFRIRVIRLGLRATLVTVVLVGPLVRPS